VVDYFLQKYAHREGVRRKVVEVIARRTTTSSLGMRVVFVISLAQKW
jgi:hypothetical protein